VDAELACSCVLEVSYALKAEYSRVVLADAAANVVCRECMEYIMKLTPPQARDNRRLISRELPVCVSPSNIILCIDVGAGGSVFRD